MLLVGGLQSIFVITVLISCLLGIVAVALKGAQVDTAQNKCILATGLIGLLLLGVAAILLFIIMFARGRFYRPVMLTIIVFVIVAMGAYIAACACSSSGVHWRSWTLAALWTSVIASIIGFAYLFIEPNKMP
ncbi:unnamed protein product [Calicophoron daubneyi]|uniref:Uncharacterized protein n=1 Tax=Calicophoron daubneyi TaxID=300641 RepID=A0AAV2T4U9_CALDB